MRKALGIGVVLLALAGCGGSDEREATGDEAVIERWSTAVREGDFDLANAQFAVPAEIFNGEPGGPVKLTEARQVDLFNRAFPCGAVLEDVQDEAGGTSLATFELVRVDAQRPCTGAVGAKAKVSFEIDDEDHITKWFRVSVEPPPGSQEA